MLISIFLALIYASFSLFLSLFIHFKLEKLVSKAFKLNYFNIAFIYLFILAYQSFDNDKLALYLLLFSVLISIAYFDFLYQLIFELNFHILFSVYIVAYAVELIFESSKFSFKDFYFYIFLALIFLSLSLLAKEEIGPADLKLILVLSLYFPNLEFIFILILSLVLVFIFAIFKYFKAGRNLKAKLAYAPFIFISSYISFILLSSG